MFLQTWPSTALGLGGIGGSAMSKAYTTVFYDPARTTFVVFFGGQFAYIVQHPTEDFFDDLMNRNLASVNKANKYRK